MTATPPSPTGPELGPEAAAVLAELPARMAHARAAPLYRVGLVLVALVMILLPLLYVALVAAVAALVYLHGVHNAWILADFGGLVAVMAYLGPMVVGVILVFFMVKPLLARRSKGPPSYRLAPEDEPLLFAFIARVCALVGAPMPAGVHVDCDVNASASFRRGWIGLLDGGLTLSVGLPLAAGLSQQQFAGVLAHEFGHFAQGAGMRLTFVIRSINGWFARVVYERDAWDAYLDQASRGSDWRVAVVLWAARMGIWFTRRILWVFMTAGHAVSSFMLRQMEYNADGYEVKLAGSAAHGPTLRRLRVLGVAAQAAMGDLRAGWQARRLPDNLPAFVVHKAAVFPEDVLQRIEQAAAGAKTGVFDSHPADADRVRAAERAGEPGLFLRAAPATALFGDFSSLAQAVTRHYYEHEQALPIVEVNLVAVAEMIEEADAQASGRAATARYYHGGFTRMATVLIGEAEIMPPVDPARSIQNLNVARATLAAGGADSLARSLLYRKLEQEAVDATVALRLAEAGFRVEPADFGLHEGSATAAAERLRELAGQQQAVEAASLGWETEARLRLASALQLLPTPRVAEHLAKAAALADEARSLVRLLASEPAVSTHLRHLRREFIALNVLIESVQGQPVTARAESTLEQGTVQIRQIVGQLQSVAADVPYPFAHSRGPLSVAEFARSDEPADNEIVQILRDAKAHLERLPPLYERALGRLVLIAEQVEAVVLGQAERPPDDRADRPVPDRAPTASSVGRYDANTDGARSGDG